MGSHSAFFYGTLMAPQILHRVIHGTATPPLQNSLLSHTPALLPAYRRHKVLSRDYPAMIPSPGSSVRGTLVRGLTDGDLCRLDRFEGEEYARVRVGVRVVGRGGEGEAGGEGGEEVQAEAYVWVAGEGQLESGEWDFETFRREKMGRWVGGWEESTEVDEAVGVGSGDPTGGRGNGGSVSGKLESQEKEVLESAV